MTQTLIYYFSLTESASLAATVNTLSSTIAFSLIVVERPSGRLVMIGGLSFLRTSITTPTLDVNGGVPASVATTFI